MRIRRCIYVQDGLPISLAFVSGIDGHPEADDTPAPAPELHHQVERRGPRRQAKPRAERGPAMTDNYIRRVLGKPIPLARAGQFSAEKARRRIMREGV
jgi:hypothetical protein